MNNRKLCNRSSELQPRNHRRIVPVNSCTDRLLPFTSDAIPSLSLPLPSISIQQRFTIDLLSSRISIRFCLSAGNENRSTQKMKKRGRREGGKRKGKFSWKRVRLRSSRQRNETIAIGAIYAISRCQPAPVFLSLIDRPPREKA